MIGGTLMAPGSTAALFAGLLTASYALDVLNDIVHSGLGGSEETWAVLRITASGLLAFGLSAVLARVGRLILGSRPPA